MTPDPGLVEYIQRQYIRSRRHELQQRYSEALHGARAMRHATYSNGPGPHFGRTWLAELARGIPPDWYDSDEWRPNYAQLRPDR